MKWWKVSWKSACTGSVIPVAFSLILLSLGKAAEKLEPDVSIQALIAQLGAEDYEKRQQAYDAIWAYGEDGVSALKDALDSSDPEVTLRAAKILRNLEAGIFFDMQPDVARWIKEFQNGTLVAKLEAFRELRKARAYKQIVYLYSWEPAGGDKDALAKELRDIPIIAARQSVYQGDLKDAYKMLKISPQSRNVTKARAYLAHRLGIADEEMRRLRDNPDEENENYELALVIGKGDKKQIQEFAHTQHLEWLQAVLNLEQANPLPAIKLIQEKLLEEGLATLHKGSKIQQLRLEGDDQAAYQQALELVRQVENMPEHEKGNVIVSLAVNGYKKWALELVEELEPLVAYKYYSTSEQPLEALRVLQVPAVEAEVSKWRTKHIERVIHGDGDERREAEGALSHMTQFYYERYGLKKALEFVLPIAKAIGEKKEYAAHDYVGECFAAMPELGVQLALELFERQQDFQYIIDECFGSEWEVGYVRELIENTQPGKSAAEYFDMLATLVGAKYQTPAEMRAQEAVLLGHMKEQEEEPRLVEALYYIASLRSDIESILSHEARLYKLHNVNSRRYSDLQVMTSQLKGDHESNIENFELHSQAISASPELLTRWAVALHFVGKKEESEEKLTSAFDLALDQVDKVDKILSILNSSQMEDAALSILKKQFRLSTPDTNEAFVFLSHIVDSYESSSRKNDWIRRSAYRECWTLMLVANRLLSVEKFNGCVIYSFESLFQQGMAAHQRGNEVEAKHLLGRAHNIAKSEGVLADHFFPELKKAGYTELHDRWFYESFGALVSVIERYPKSHNTLNTAAWLGARSVRKLEESTQLIDRALELRPRQGAYLDTKAELLFARGNREDALIWSEKAVKSTQDGSLSPTIRSRVSRPGNEGGFIYAIDEYTMLKGQLRRFEKEAIPQP